MILALLSRILISERVIGNDRLMLFEMQGFFSLYLEKIYDSRVKSLATRLFESILVGFHI